ncbi:MAG TPA: hypothetical protein ENN19_00920 [Chloroflexi bacterium]|nr:hypothetical protein [Chloroflexota bacterium]
MPGIAPLTELRDMMVEWAVIISAFAFLLGLLNVLQVHGRHIRRRRSGWFYSLILVLAMLLTWIPPAFQSLGLDFLGIPVSSEAQAMLATTSQWIFDYVITPLGASLAALLAFTLVLAALRIFRARLNAWAVIFLVTVVVVLLGSIPFTTGLEWLTGIRSWIIDVLSTAGIRGLLLGVALGVIVTALRVFIVSEQPYSES